MPATPIYALPYPVAGDPSNIPHDIEVLAERVEVLMAAARQREPIILSFPANWGPTGVNAVAPGDAIADLGNYTLRNQAHWFEFTGVFQSTSTNHWIALNLMDGAYGAGGAVLAQLMIWAPIANVPFSASMRARFTPPNPGVSRHYHLKWQSSNAGVNWTAWNASYFNGQLSVREALV